jgi:hypothetical protein
VGGLLPDPGRVGRPVPELRRVPDQPGPAVTDRDFYKVIGILSGVVGIVILLMVIISQVKVS